MWGQKKGECISFDLTKMNALPSCLPPSLPPYSNLGSEHNLSVILCPLSPSLSQTEALFTFQGASNHLSPCPPLFSTAIELSDDSYGDERVYGVEGSEVNSEDSDIQEVLPVPNPWASLGKKGKIG